MNWIIWTALAAIGGAAALDTAQLTAAVFTLAQAAQWELSHGKRPA
jgi:hypothetical protein